MEKKKRWVREVLGNYMVELAQQDAAGLCREGFKPYAFSMASFVSMRACEQCRTDIAYANADAVLVGVYAGVSGGLSGATHWSIEDCAIFSAFPNMTVLEPSDGVQAQKMLRATLNHKGPVYIRVSVVPSADIYPPDYEYEIEIAYDPGEHRLHPGRPGSQHHRRPGVSGCGGDCPGGAENQICHGGDRRPVRAHGQARLPVCPVWN